ncbi:MAG: hypothetical protein COW00_10245 [Bdellovibrio sp. CG12_big_fil_rev_8_21_14_0_65_39_13]|nr:MAG: hypothetical protein COW78_01070 [Bdellovibrio sp. CG22_combo_CG10-13_8_21_14_all_39_27]PIQ59491.1 MAG: hypothetical protein COW00_10245 [Bdellovibrio sp. CG12_big_fil_rev_8_21_14_0_65_39_13]PIR33505.1 MAG: hypothetical protein COV37_16240 [Bdellovibrio sp. CG11_big_fil_rev_8_21_14_0_20_39_38]
MDQGIKLAKAFEELVDFLDRNPELLGLQIEIEEHLKQAGDNPEERLMLLMKLIQEKLNHELLPNFEILQAMLNETCLKIIKNSKVG